MTSAAFAPREPSAAARARDASRQCVSFAAGGEQYAIDIMSVREIKGWSRVTGLPNQPDHVRGVLNLRGAVLPIIDLQRRLGGDFTQATERHVIVIVAVRSRLVGLLVDAVSDILSVDSDQIQPVPESASRDEARMFSGFITENGQMIAMLDLEQATDDACINLSTDGDGH